MILETSKHTGVSWNKQRQKWKAELWVGGKTRYLGLFAEEAEAAEAVAAPRPAHAAGRLQTYIEELK